MGPLRALLCMCVLLAGSGPVQGANAPTAPVYTNKTRFRIPFKFERAEIQALGAREIRLYVSLDRGLSWKQSQTVSPQAEKFNFQADADGEFWFLVRTLDSQNRLHPDGAPTEPGLQVVVDTTSPQLKLDLKQSSAGRVQLNWTASDSNLDVTQLRLEYIQPGQPDWQQVSVVPKALGQTEWSVTQGGVVAVRGQIADLAKNSVQAQAQLRVAAAPEGAPPATNPSARHPVASSEGTGPMPAPGLAPPSTNQDLAAGPAVSTPNDFRPLPALGSQGSSVTDPLPGRYPLAQRGSPAMAPISSTRDLSSGSDLEGYGPQIREQHGAGNMGGAAGGNGSPGRYRMVNTLRFQLGYKIQDVGPSGIAAIELYATENEGRTWYRYGEDPDMQSPAIVEVRTEGIYGFDLRVRSGAGLGNDPPQSGDRPPIVVIVDQTPPKVDLLPLEQGQGRAINRLLVQWKYQDLHPHERPVQLLYSAGPQGPWQSISGWIENTGKYVWIVGPDVPSRFYFRLEARDAAANSKVVESPQPVLIDLARPTARIIDIEVPTGTELPR